jgi:hypothetical protein
MAIHRPWMTILSHLLLNCVYFVFTQIAPALVFLYLPAKSTPLTDPHIVNVNSNETFSFYLGRPFLGGA